MKETPFAIVLIAFVAFIAVLSGVVLLAFENQGESFLNQPTSIDNQTAGNLMQNTINTTNQSNLKDNNSNNNQNNISSNGTGNLNNNTTETNTTNTTFRSYTVKSMVDLKTSMRDGVELVSDIWLPQEEGQYPVIIIRTPYGRSAAYMNYTGMGEYFANQGYVFMVQDVRGKGDSEGDFNFLFQEGQDGYDTVEWAANQSWSNGRVGMMGSSYTGAAQWLTAREKPPHLVCIAPTSATGRYMEEIPSIGGVFYMGWALPWTLANNGRSMDSNTENINWTNVFNHRPLINADEVTGTQVPLYRQFLEHSTLDDYWMRIQFTDQDFTTLNLPAMTTSGWFDTHQPGALFYWKGMKNNSTSETDQYLIIGPWTNNGTFQTGDQTSKIGDLSVSGAQADVYARHLAFFDSYLKNSTSSPKISSPNNTSTSSNSNSNETNNNFNLSRVTIYLTGLSKWINLTEYPPEDINLTPLYLASGGQANTYQGNGFLSWNLIKPSSNNSNTQSDIASSNTSTNTSPNTSLNASSDSYTYDPANPRSVAMGNFAVNSLNTENRSDVLIYTTPPLEEPVMILGPVTVELYAASDARDTDFVARLIDVYPNGTAINLGPEECGGAIRARFRQGFDREVLLEPGKIEKYRIELFDIGHVFLEGHRIRLEISSSAYPMLQPNPNTGNPIATDTQQQVAHQTIYHDQQHPSAVLLPIIPENSSFYTQIFG